MKVELVRHPSCPPDSVQRVKVRIARSLQKLELRYNLLGEMRDLGLPMPHQSRRRDELWKTTCFEAFIKPQGGEAYLEFNFAPTTDWASYHFTAYRKGMRNAETTPSVEVDRGWGFFDLIATIPLGPELRADQPWRLGLSAITEIDGAKSYWALAHPQGKPDFHHADSFAIELPPEQT
jgi:hypothetical protein